MDKKNVQKRKPKILLDKNYEIPSNTINTNPWLSFLFFLTVKGAIAEIILRLSLNSSCKICMEKLIILNITIG